MRTKITTLVTTCCIAALALTVAAPTLACDKDKDGAKTVQAAGPAGTCCPSKQAAVLTAKSGEGECPVERSAKHMMTAIEKMDGCCGEKCPSRADMVLAVRSLASVKEGLVCEKTLAKLTGETAVLSVSKGEGATCSSKDAAKAATLVVSKGEGATCSSKDAAKAATLVVSKGEGATCSSKDAAKAATLVVSKGEGATCSSKDAAKAATLVVSKGEGATCGSKDAAKAATLVVSKGEGATCGSKDAAKAATLVVSKGEGATCGSKDAAKAATLVVSKGEGATCGSKDAAKAATLVVSKGEGTSCCSSEKLTDAKLVATTGGTCTGEKAANARYVAFGCEKSDRVARAVAQAYLAVMKEIKATSGAEACSYSTASEVLATLLEEMQDEAQAAAASETVVADAK